MKSIRPVAILLAGILTTIGLAAAAPAVASPKPLPGTLTIPAGCSPGSQADLLVNRAVNVRGHLTRARFKLPSGYEVDITPESDPVVVALVGARDAEILYVCYSAN